MQASAALRNLQGELRTSVIVLIYDMALLPMTVIVLIYDMTVLPMTRASVKSKFLPGRTRRPAGHYEFDAS